MNRPAHDVVAETQDPSAPVVLRTGDRDADLAGAEGCGFR
jgi:hypothetical protein